MKQNLTLTSYLRTLSIIHTSLIMGPIILGALLYFDTTKESIRFSFDLNTLFYVVPIVGLAGIFIGNLLYRNFLARIPTNLSLKQKLVRYQTASITKYALVEIPTFLGVFAFMITHNLFFLLVSAVLVLYFISLRPTTSGLAKNLELTRLEKSIFERPDEPI
ncbi:MAG: hypothetical protein AAF765_05220 [Bacteroidota bacterium]